MRIFCLGLILLFPIMGCNKNPTDQGGISPGLPVYPVIDDFPSWSPDGSTIVYHHLHYTYIDSETGGGWIDYDSTGIWFINPDGSNNRMFLRDGDLPDWSPDGKWLVFVQGAQVYKIKVNGDSLTQLTFEGRNFFPDWSPDGKKIAYDSNAKSSVGGYSIWIMDADGIHNYDAVAGRFADWSPDGRELTYIGLGGEVYRVDLNINKQIQLTSSYGDARCPIFSPDGSQIAFGSAASNYGLWVMNIDGSNQRLLTEYWSESHSWSPDGSQIVYTRYKFAEFSEENGHLWIMDSNGENKRQLTFRKK